MEKYQKIVVTGFLYHKGKVLLIKRSEDETFMPGKFEMPGGKVDFGENPEESLVREFKEETDLDIKVWKPFSVFSYVSEESQRHTVEIVYFVSLSSDNEMIILGVDHSEYEWVDKSELDLFIEDENDQLRQVIEEGFKIMDIAG